MDQVVTLVEFFSHNTINNVLGCFAFAPRTVIYLTDHSVEESQRQGTLRAVHSRLPQTQVEFLTVEEEKLDSIRAALEALWQQHPEAVFDFTGGSETMLLASFSFAVRHDAPMMHIHMESRSLVNIQGCEALERQFVFPRLTLEDHLNMNGAFLAGNGYQVPDDSCRERLRGFCELVLENQPKWKEQCLYIQMAAARAKDLQVDNLLEFRTADGVAVPGDVSYLRRLEQVGMLKDLKVQSLRIPFDDNERSVCIDGDYMLEPADLKETARRLREAIGMTEPAEVTE